MVGDIVNASPAGSSSAWTGSPSSWTSQHDGQTRILSGRRRSRVSSSAASMNRSAGGCSPRSTTTARPPRPHARQTPRTGRSTAGSSVADRSSPRRSAVVALSPAAISGRPPPPCRLPIGTAAGPVYRRSGTDLPAFEGGVGQRRRVAIIGGGPPGGAGRRPKCRSLNVARRVTFARLRQWLRTAQSYGIAPPKGSIRSVFDGSWGCVAQFATIASSLMPLKPVQMPGGITTSE